MWNHPQKAVKDSVDHRSHFFFVRFLARTIDWVLVQIRNSYDSKKKHKQEIWANAHEYGGLLEPKRSKLTLLKSTFNVQNFTRRLSWSIFSEICLQETRDSTLSKTRSLYLTWAWIGTGSWQTRTDRPTETNGQNYGSLYALSTTCCRAQKAKKMFSLATLAAIVPAEVYCEPKMRQIRFLSHVTTVCFYMFTILLTCLQVLWRFKQLI